MPKIQQIRWDEVAKADRRIMDSATDDITQYSGFTL